MKNIKINNKYIGDKYPPFIIAEISANHKKSLQRIYKIINAASVAGFDAIKVQTYKPETITMKINSNDFKIKDKKSLWYNKTLYEIYKKGSLPWEWHEKISKFCKKKKIIFFSSPFDETAVDLLERLNVNLYKVASFEINHHPLLKKIAQTKKTVILSTGMASVREIQLALKTLKKNGCKNVILLKCTSSYPASSEDSNLLTIKNMKKRFNLNIGLSDHTVGFASAISAISLGANIIEKHVTIKKNDGGLDSQFSLELNQFQQFILECKNAKKSIGKVMYGPTKSEIPSLKFRRSIYISKNIMVGEKITKKNVKVVRPALSLDPINYERIMGMKVKKNLRIGDKLYLRDLK